jgi:hypothetical protein
MRVMTPFESSFFEYEKLFNNYASLLQDENIPRELRLFDIRFRLAIDLVVDYKGNVSYTKTPIVKNNYAQQMKLMELWNSYEALVRYLAYLGLNRGNKAKYEQIILTLIKDSKVYELFLQCFQKLKNHYIADTTFKNEYNEYIGRIQRGVRPKLAESCTRSRDYFIGTGELSGYELFALIYAERNLFYHNGESAKLGMSYNRRNTLLSEYYDNFALGMIMIAKHIIKQEIDSQ